MQFDDQELDLNLTDERVRVIIKTDLIHVLWGEGVGPQTAEGIVLSNTEIIRALAAEKATQSRNRPIEISAMDYEQEDDGGV